MNKAKRLFCLLLVIGGFAAHTAESTDVETASDTAAKTIVEVLGQISKPAAEDGKQQSSEASDGNKIVDTEDEQSETADNTKQATSNPMSNLTLLTIGSGSVGGNYFLLGEILGTVISHPTLSLPCGKGGTCGVEGLQSINIATAGSVDNLKRLSDGSAFTGFVQSGIAYWAYTATGPFARKEKMDDLRAVASLYPEMIHVIVRKNLNAKSVADLKGKRVSVGTRHSGTLNSTRAVLEAYGMTEDDLEPEYLNLVETMEKMKAGELDAFFITMGAPAPFITSLFNEAGEEDVPEFQILNIGGTEREKILALGHYFSPANIPAGTYKGVGEVDTVSMYALWLTTTKADADLIYKVTKALWDENSALLLNAFPVGKNITLDNSLNGIGIPLHEGAKKFYDEVGKKF